MCVCVCLCVEGQGSPVEVVAGAMCIYSHVCQAEGQPRLRLRDRRMLATFEDPCGGLGTWSGVFWWSGMEESLMSWVLKRMEMSVDRSFEEFSYHREQKSKMEPGGGYEVSESFFKR